MSNYLPDNYYDRQGRRVLTWEQLKTIERRVARDVLPTGHVVSTVWLGLDHSFRGGPPLIFETMVFADEDSFMDLESDRYSTEAEALEGHARMVARVLAGEIAR